MLPPLPSDSAAYLAGRIRSLHGIAGTATAAKILAVARERGCLLQRDASLLSRCHFHGEDDRLLALIQYRGRPHALDAGHELGHYHLWENTLYGILYPDLEKQDPEAVMARYARAVVTGEGLPLSLHQPAPLPPRRSVEVVALGECGWRRVCRFPRRSPGAFRCMAARVPCWRVR